MLKNCKIIITPDGAKVIKWNASGGYVVTHHSIPEISKLFFENRAFQTSMELPEPLIKILWYKGVVYLFYVLEEKKYDIKWGVKTYKNVPQPVRLWVLGVEENHGGYIRDFLLGYERNTKPPQIFRYPTPNIGTAGWVCWGDDTPRTKYRASNYKQIDSLFFQMSFNNDLLCCDRNNFEKYLLEQKKNKKFSFEIYRKYIGRSLYPLSDLINYIEGA